MSFIENESATFEDLCLRLERDFPGSPAAAMLHRFYEWRRYTLTLQREADGLREALERIAAGDGVYGAQAHEYKQIARAALNVSPQEPVS